MELSAADREFFEQVSVAVYANPFGERRHEVDLRLAQGVEGVAERQGLIDAVMQRVRSRLSALAGGGQLDLRTLPEPVRAVVQPAVLFECFHRYADAIDEHIEQQLAAGSEPCSAELAPALLEHLGAHGLDRREAVRMLEVFFQMRRAFTFIDRALTGSSPCMRGLRQALWNNIFTHDLARYERWLWDRMEDFSTILLGETGTGKGMAAASIGRAGFIPFDAARGRFTESFTESFVAVNLSQFPAGLIESELFGHVKGAFTGAVERHEGALSRCSPHGAIFLDEIGEVEVPVQIKLLRVLQEREFSPVGSHRVQRFSGRVIAATHQDLERRRAEGRFRDDFYYRLCSDVIEVPSLRRRIAEDPDELERLVAVVLERTLGRPAPSLVDEVVGVIARELPSGYPWPGNVRELEQCVRRVLMTRHCAGDRAALAPDEARRLHRALDVGELPARELVRDYCRLLYARHGTYEEVARRTGLDRRTVKRHVHGAAEAPATS